MRRNRATWRGAIALAVTIAMIVALPVAALAEGTRDLVANGGYRPYTERYNAATLGEQRLSVMHVYLEEGETVYLGTSVATAMLYDTATDGTKSGWLFSNSAMGTSYSDTQLTYVNTADVYVAKGNYANIADAIGAGMTPGKSGVTLVDLADGATKTTPGYIYDSVQEVGGVDLTGTGTGAGYKVTSDNTISTSTSGYVAGVKTNANTFTADETGIYTVVFFSSAHSGENPVKKLASDTTPFAQTQKGGTIASWDISVYDGGNLQTGRVFTSTLFINMGGNVLSNGVSKGSLYSDVYAVTDDGYQYKVDFNGMDPFGFVFFANNRGLLKTDGAAENPVTSSLYHGLRSDNNTLSDVASHGIELNATPTDSRLDKTYNLFYEQPASSTLKALGISDPSTSGDISNFTFTGNEGTAKVAGTGYVGEGGTFSFNVGSVSATSYEIDLDFSSIGGGTVVLSNTLRSGANSISWNGRDANGKIVPAGTYSFSNISVKLKGGEVHFPLLDVEQNPNGIKIQRLNGTSPNSTVYFNNSASNAGDTTTPWTLEKNWLVGSQADATKGVDSSNGAMAFTNTNSKSGAKGSVLLGDGDQCALDVWAYYDTPATMPTGSFSLVDAFVSFTVTKAWDNTGGTPAAGNPSVKMTLFTSGGEQVTTDVTGAAIENPVTISANSKDLKNNAWAHTWEHLDPTKTYYVSETALTGYSTKNSGLTATVTGSVADGYAQTVTNTYVPTKLTISKVWNHGTETEEPSTDWPASVTIHVYTDAAKTHEITGSPVTLTSASTDEAGNKWAQTITGLDSTVSYYCYEDAVTGYHSSTGGLASGSATSGYKSTFTNTFESKTYAYAQVLKQWSGDIIDGVSYRPSSVTMTLINKDTGEAITKDAAGKAIFPETLTADNSWYHAWPMLPKTDAAGKTINYNIVETSLPGYTASADPEDSPLVTGNPTSVIYTNAYQTTSFTASKIWDSSVSSSQPTSVVMVLQQSIDGAPYVDYGDPVTITKNSTDAKGNAWAHTWTSLPSYSASGKPIAYKVYETEVSGYDTTYGSLTGNAADGYAQTITNTYKYTSITVSKVWEHGTQAETDWPQSVNVALRDDKGAYATCALSADNNWTYTFTNVPIPTSGDTTEGIYTVEEVSIDGYTTTQGGLSGSDAAGWTVTLTNTYDYTNLDVTKYWDDNDNAAGKRPSSVEVELFADGVDTGKSATLDATNSWKASFDGLAKGVTYSVTETLSSNAGYYTSLAPTVSGSDVSGWQISLRNTYSPTFLQVFKHWDHGVQDEANWPTSVTFQLYADGVVYGDPVTLTAADENPTQPGVWLHTWEGLDRTKTYTVKELPVKGYSTTGGTVNGTGSTTGFSAIFTNTYVEPTSPASPTSPITSVPTTTVETPVTPATPELPVTPVETTPSTNDTSNPLLYVLLGIAGVALVAIAVAIARHGKDK